MAMTVCAMVSQALFTGTERSCRAAVEEIKICLERDTTSAETLYAAACVTSISSESLAISELQQQTIDFLERAIENGTEVKETARDPDLRFLKHHPRFRELVPLGDLNQLSSPSA